MFGKFLEATYWFRIFLSPICITVVLIGAISSLSAFNWLLLLLFIPAALIGTLMAEKARKRRGTSNYWSQPMNTPDLQETWESEKKS